jgi:hypothetical protein
MHSFTLISLLAIPAALAAPAKPSAAFSAIPSEIVRFDKHGDGKNFTNSDDWTSYSKTVSLYETEGVSFSGDTRPTAEAHWPSSLSSGGWASYVKTASWDGQAEASKFESISAPVPTSTLSVSKPAAAPAPTEYTVSAYEYSLLSNSDVTVVETSVTTSVLY